MMMKKKYSVLCVLINFVVVCSCTHEKTNQTKQEITNKDSIKTVNLGPIKTMNPQTKNGIFAQKLVDRKFGDFFIYPMHDETLDSIWQDQANHKLLEDIIEDDSISDEAKFLACVVLDKMDVSYGMRHSPEKVVDIYAKALVNNFTGMANSWGLLYDHRDDGTMGVKFISMGKYSVPVLTRLLDNEQTNLTYQGSIEATIGNGYKYRIKDFAAYYLGRMMGKPLKYYPDLSDRDKQIEKLKEDLKTYKFD